MPNEITAKYKEFKLIDDFTVRQDEDYNAIFKNGKPKHILKRKTSVYNKIYDYKARAIYIEMKEDKISIEFKVESEIYENPDLNDFCINIGEEKYTFIKTTDAYKLDIPYDRIKISGKIAGIFLYYKDENGFTFKRKMLSMTGPHNKKEDHELYYSELKTFDKHAIFVYETWAGYLSINYREKNATDSFINRKKIEYAYKKYEKDLNEGKAKPSILLFEKFCEKYEESARYVFERLIDDGWDNVFYILDKKSQHYKNVPKKYRKYIIKKHSIRHFYEYFNAKAFISTESMNHAIDTSVYNPLIRRRQMLDNYYYYFLQHGIMYTFSLKGRYDFVKNSGFRDNSFVVISSETEGRHFIEEGKFDRNDLIKCGLPKYDYTYKNEDADKILIMPTSRNFEYSVIRDDTKNSTYYNFAKNIIESVPDELKEKVILLPHPLVNKIIGKTELNKYIPEKFIYNELLKDTALLITDFSSLSYDAFYRGSNVIFAWMEKQLCMENQGIEIKISDENAFGDVAYDYEKLKELISKNYFSKQSEENIKKYNDIVEFHDGKNTERFVNYIYGTNLLHKEGERYDINDAKVTGIKNKPYTGEEIKFPSINVNLNGKKLVEKLDYDVEYHDNIDIGTAECEINGKGIYTGTKTVNFKIIKNIKETKIKLNENGLEVSMNKKPLSKDIDYISTEVDYPGICLKKIVVKGKDDYIGQKRILIDMVKKD